MGKTGKMILVGIGAFGLVYFLRKGATARPGRRVEELVADPIFFDFDSSTINQEGQGRLRELASLLNSSLWQKVILTGHTDSAGSANYNHELGLRRAASVAGALEQYGLEKPQGTEVILRSRGSSEPFAANDTATGRAMNRRVEIEIVA